MAKSKGISKLFLTTTFLFTEEFLNESLELGILGLEVQRNIKEQIYKKVEERLKPIIENYFKSSIADTNQIMSSNISKLVDQTKVPFKYNKDLLQTYNNTKSVFSGYYDVDVKDVFTKREIDLIKRTVLNGKYSNLSSEELATNIRNAVGTTRNRALNIARIETTRLGSASNSIYFADKNVQEQYDLIFRTADDDKVRKDHKSYDDKKANAEGYFSGNCGDIAGAPVPCSPWNCRCYTELVKKSDK